jgi:type IV secretory pathway VirB10-like protein
MPKPPNEADAPEINGQEPKLETTPPKRLMVETEAPKPKSAIKERFRILLILGVALTLFAVAWGFYRQMSHVAHQKQIQLETKTASEAATSSRKNLEAQSESAIRPVSAVYGNTPGAASAQSTSRTHPEIGYQPQVSANANPGQSGYATAATGAPQLTAWQQAELDELKDLKEARSAGIDQRKEAGGISPSSPPPSGAAVTKVSPQETSLAPGSDTDVSSAINQLLHPASNPSGMSFLSNDHAADYKNQNDQAGKQDFSKPTDDSTLLASPRVDPPGLFMLMQGSRIPVSLDPTIKSDLPGEVTSIVRKDVHDSKTGKYTLIPAGTRVVGYYNSSVTYGQQAVQVGWSRLIYPDTTSQMIGKMMAYDADGSSGLHDQVDNHWKRIIGGVALSSMLSAGLAISQNRNNGTVLSYPSTGQEIGAAVGQQSSQLGQQITSRAMNIQPTIKIRPGDIFYISVNKDVMFAGPYVPR